MFPFVSSSRNDGDGASGRGFDRYLSVRWVFPLSVCCPASSFNTLRLIIEMYLLLVRLLLVAVLVALSVVFFGWTLGVLYVIMDVLFF